MKGPAELLEDEKARQREITYRLLSKTLVPNDTWYVLDARWYDNFRSYVGLDQESDSNLNEGPPGCIDNSPILTEDGELREDLCEQSDFVLVPEELWVLLVKWYGIAEDQKPIPRKVIEFGTFSTSNKVEIYLLRLRFALDYEFGQILTLKFSKSDSIRHVADCAGKAFGVSPYTPIKLVTSFNNKEYEALDPTSTVSERRLYVNQLIVVDTGATNNARRKATLAAYVEAAYGENENAPVSPSPEMITNSEASTDDNFAAASTGDRSNVSTRYGTGRLGSRPTQPGLCGLSNLGNTCFMNSVIQCMSNCPPLTQYFLDDSYRSEVNTVNPLGMKGQIALAFAELIKTLWSGQSAFTVPHNFKHQVGRFAPQFWGYQQHDSQELLTFLLDGLHEDLNRIREKPYVEQRDAGGRSDREVAEESWGNYRRRNDSVIVDLFHGLLKSTVVCPDCSEVSVTFDPFCYLSLPLPVNRDRTLEAIFVPRDPSEELRKYRLCLPRRGQVRNLLTALGSATGTDPDRLVLAGVESHHFHKFYSADDPLDDVSDRNDLFAYELPAGSGRDNLVLPVCMWEHEPDRGFNFGHLFGTPLLVTVTRGPLSYAVLYDAVVDRLSPFLVPQSDDSGGDCLGSMTSAEPLFSLCVVNPGAGSVIYKLHGGNTPVDLPEQTVLGQQYLVAAWSRATRIRRYRVPEMGATAEVRPTRCPPPLHLHDCIELYAATEQLGADDAWYCPVCKQHVCATKKFDLWSLPRILIIHLKRFSYSRFRRGKIDVPVEFPTRGLDVSRYVIDPDHPRAVYDLIGVCNHYGGMGGGHYTAFARNKLDGRWYCFDDSSVTEVLEESVVTRAAYVLFYQRVD